MRTVKIVADSSANLLTLSDIAFASVPMKVMTAEHEYVDDEHLDIPSMVEDLQHYKGRSSSACPSVGEWLAAFGDADEVYCVAITATLSGSYNAACMAKQLYEEQFPDRHVCVLNSLSAGPELQLLVEKLQELLVRGLPFEEVCAQLEDYREQTGLLFSLESLKNFANNGRVSPLLAKAVGLLGIRVVGRAGDKGDLEPLDKCRGQSRALDAIVAHLKEFGYAGGKLYIHHCQNEAAAEELRARVTAAFTQARVMIAACRGLCSFYAEHGGLLVGYERG